MHYLIGACDIYAAPSRLEGFAMPQVEAGACEKPVTGIKAMGMLDTLIHGETAYLSKIARKIFTSDVILGEESGLMHTGTKLYPMYPKHLKPGEHI